MTKISVVLNLILSINEFVGCNTSLQGREHPVLITRVLC